MACRWTVTYKPTGTAAPRPSPRSTRRTAGPATRSSACPRAGSRTAASATTRRACDGRRAAASTAGRRSSRPPRIGTTTRPTTASARRRRRSGPRGSQLAVLATYQASMAWRRRDEGAVPEKRTRRQTTQAMETNQRNPRPRGPHRRRRPRAALRGVRGPLARRPRPALVRLLPRPRARARAVLGRVLALLHPGQRRPRARDRRAVRGLRRPRAPRAVLARGRLDGRRGRGRAALRGPRWFASASGQHFALPRHRRDASKKKREDQKTKNAQARATATARARCPS